MVDVNITSTLFQNGHSSTAVPILIIKHYNNSHMGDTDGINVNKPAVAISILEELYALVQK